MSEEWLLIKCEWEEWILIYKIHKFDTQNIEIFTHFKVNKQHPTTVKMYKHIIANQKYYMTNVWKKGCNSYVCIFIYCAKTTNSYDTIDKCFEPLFKMQMLLQ